MAVAETTFALTKVGASHAAAVAVERDRRWAEGFIFAPDALKVKYGKRGAVPKRWDEIPPELIGKLPLDVLRQCFELVRLGRERSAIRLAYCGKLGRVYSCVGCGLPAKKISHCKGPMCLRCAPRNFDALFRRFLGVENLISPAVRCLPGWTWNILDFGFRHDGDFPKQWELRFMVKIIRRTVARAVREACREWNDVRQQCRLRFNEDGTPMMSYDGWPIASAQDGSARVLVGWTVVRFPEHVAPDNEARKQGARGAKKTIPETWKLRFGYELIRVREFGFDNVNAHFHCAYFGPRLDYWKNREGGHLVCGGRLVAIFKEETRRPIEEGGLGVESYTVYFERAQKGFRSVLAHALKYTKKLAASSPEKRAELECVGQGTRRVALLGAHYGVPLKSRPCDLRCPSCGNAVKPLEGLGLVPLSEIAGLPDVIGDEPVVVDEDLREPGADEFLEEEVRAP